MELEEEPVPRLSAPHKLRMMLSIEEVVVALGLSRAGVYNLFASGELPWVQIGQRRLVAVEDAKEFIKRHRHGGRYVEDQPPRTTLSKGSKAQRARRKSEKDVPLAKRYATAERAQRASVPASGPVTTAAD